MNTRRHQTGFGLIEVLVSLLIVSIGLLGIAALQITSLKNVGSSMERSQAVFLTYSYMDVLRANRDKAVLAEFDVPVMTCDPEFLDETLVEQRKWLTQLHQRVGPGSCGQVVCALGEAGTCTVTVQWDDSHAEGGSTTQQLRTETKL